MDRRLVGGSDVDQNVRGGVLINEDSYSHQSRAGGREFSCVWWLCVDTDVRVYACVNYGGGTQAWEHVVWWEVEHRLRTRG